MRAGCYGTCGDAIVESSVPLDFRCRYEITGTVIDFGSGKALEGAMVQFLLAGRVLYRTRTGHGGRFKIATERGSRKDCVVRYSFGRMPTEIEARGTEGIMVVGSLSEKFRSAHKALKFEWIEATGFVGRTIDLGKVAGK